MSSSIVKDEINQCFPASSVRSFIDEHRCCRPTILGSRCVSHSIRFIIIESIEYARANIYGSVSVPFRLFLDDHGYLLTVSCYMKSLVRFYLNEWTRLDPAPLSTFADTPCCIAPQHGAHFVEFPSYILIVYGNYKTLVPNISASSMNSVRELTSPNEGQ